MTWEHSINSCLQTWAPVSQECVNTKVVLLSELLTNGWAGQIEVMPSGLSIFEQL
jgi:hypothetical protein